jgi:hypothetical protein
LVFLHSVHQSPQYHRSFAKCLASVGGSEWSPQANPGCYLFVFEVPIAVDPL